MQRSLNDFTERYFKHILGVLFLCTIVYVLSGGLQIHNDSDGYIDMSIIRLPVYSLLVQLLYSESFGIPLLLVQIGSICTSVYLLVNTLKQQLQLKPFWYILLTFVLLAPSITGDHIANNVLSEAIAYALYLLAVNFTCLAFFKEDRKYIIWLLPVIFLLLLTRGQFIFVVAVAFLLLAWISYQQKTFKKNALLFLLILALPTIVSLSDKTYHKVVNGHFVKTPWTGVHLLTPAIYLANASDSDIYTEASEKEFFKAVFAKLEERELNLHSSKAAQLDPVGFYRDKYTRITNWTLYYFGKEQLGQSLSEDEKFIKLEQMTSAITPSLVIKNFKAWANLNIRNFISGFGNIAIAIFFFIVLAFGLFHLRKNSSNIIKILILGAILTISNMAIIAIGIHTIKRFTFYNDWVFYLILFVLLNSLASGLKERVSNQKTSL
ncbi:hypothetical protein [Ulvibacter antarcticus]|uniref:Dolichyl-phosphate-mannose-protein mannosyltransferase n=1 Tax=Ulvibacter antarcticus TaxID=442714 RepID=A0A3L9YBL0_9FLAO|nr:hypothetical protein [Ulvibacter antarcticus]RMA56740.1 hypothetical protein BXY75_3254 [Ulvibacter antarcticus]